MTYIYILFQNLNTHHMKIVKQLKPYHPEEELLLFFKQIPLMSIILLVSLPAISLFQYVLKLQQTKNQHNSQQIQQIYNSPLSIFILDKFSEIFWFLLIGVSLFKKQESYGSLYFTFSFIIKSTIIYASHYFLSCIVNEWPGFKLFSKASIPLQFILCIIVSNAVEKPQNLTYFLIKPFQIKMKFLPVFICFLFQTMGLKIDIIIPIFIGFIFSISQLNKKLKRISSFIQRKIPLSSLQSYGFIKSGNKIKSLKQIDIIATDNSIVLEEK